MEDDKKESAKRAAKIAKRDAEHIARSRSRFERDVESGRIPEHRPMAGDDSYRDGLMNTGARALRNKEGYRS